MDWNKAILEDCIEIDKFVAPNSVDLIYLDPPFFTQKVQQQKSKDGTKHFSFRDIWESDSDYVDYLFQRLVKFKPILKDTGSIFFHCDKTASHIIRLLLDNIFGEENFRSEIIWYFKRWSNSKKGLLPAHQTIFFYSKSSDFKFRQVMQEYSATTNIDQIMQKRARDSRGKSVYARSENGEVLTGGAKKGVPLSDVWEIPFLNPKAKERTGYPTQKPILLLNRIIELATDEGDIVLDPFCGSGTTLVAAKELNRKAMGFDISEDAIELTKERLKNPIITTSALLDSGRESYNQHSIEAKEALRGVDYTPIHRNKGIDGLLKQEVGGKPVFLRVQRENESITSAITALKNGSQNKGNCIKILIRTQTDNPSVAGKIDGIYVFPTITSLVNELIDENNNSVIIPYTNNTKVAVT